ncbi:bifunctional diguanylate cyclase/phosphodiesterase [Persephonella sp.]
MVLEKLLLVFPIRYLFPAFIVLLFLITSIIFAYSEINSGNKRLEKEKLNYVCGLAANIQDTVEFLAGRGDIKLFERKLVNISADPYIKLLFVADPSGKIIISSRRNLIGKDYKTAVKQTIKENPEELLRAVSSFSKKKGIFCRIVEGGKTIVGISPILFGEPADSLRPDKTGFILIAYDLEKVKRLHRQEIILKIYSEFGILSIMLIAIYVVFNKMIAQRINRIVEAVNQIEKGDLDVRIDLRGKDEFAFIASIINQLIEKLNRYITVDYLTGILNRFGLEKQIEKMLKTNKDMWNVFIFIDLDNFKDINDTFGHDFGDEMLKAFAKRLKLVAGDRTIGRLGGDEFIIFFQSKEKPALSAYMQNLLHSLSGTMNIWNQSIDIYLTAGVTVKKGSSTSFFELLKESDIALYYGKKKGKKLFVLFNDEIKLKEERRIKLTEILKKAVENEDFYLVYQPILDLTSGRIISAEALLRMKSSELGEVSPAEFVPILEDTGLIKEVGYFVIEQVCRDINYFRENKIEHITVSINVDIQQILDKDFVSIVEKILKTYSVDPSSIKIEITETEAMKFPERVISVLKQLKEIGIEIYIDDFGTGYSSLSHLKMMPVSCIKIDRSFIKNVPYSREDNILVMSIINLAKSLGYRTIAEGVEEKVQVLFLREIGGDYMQGFYFSKPVDKDTFLQLIKNNVKLQA